MADKKAEMRKRIAERKARAEEAAKGEEGESKGEEERKEVSKDENGEVSSPAPDAGDGPKSEEKKEGKESAEPQQDKQNDSGDRDPEASDGGKADAIDQYLTPQVSTDKNLAATRIQSIARGASTRRQLQSEKQRRRPKKGQVVPPPGDPPPSPRAPPSLPPVPRSAAAPTADASSSASSTTHQRHEEEIESLRKKLAASTVELKRTKRQLHESAVKNENLFKEFTTQMQKLREKADATTTEMTQEFDVLAQELANAKRALASRDAERERMHQMRVDQEAEISA